MHYTLRNDSNWWKQDIIPKFQIRSNIESGAEDIHRQYDGRNRWITTGNSGINRMREILTVLNQTTPRYKQGRP